jgi:hypothetical protein
MKFGIEESQVKNPPSPMRGISPFSFPIPQGTSPPLGKWGISRRTPSSPYGEFCKPMLVVVNLNALRLHYV